MRRFIPYGSTESTERGGRVEPECGVARGFIPYGSTESTESRDYESGGVYVNAVSSHTARPRALKAVQFGFLGRGKTSFIPYGSTESTERLALQRGAVQSVVSFIPYGSTESTESQQAWFL